MSQTLRQLRSDIADHLEDIRAMFKDEVRITVLIRNLEREDADVIVTDDEARAIIKCVKELDKKPRVG